MNKRNFLKTSAALMAGTILSPAVQAGNPAGLPVYRTLGKTGIKVPVVSSGIIPQNSPALIRKLFESGIKHFDSAWEYQNGRNDTMLGEMLKEYGRENFVISTKVLLPYDEKKGQYLKSATTAAFMDQLEITMTRLGVDYVDILYLHKPPSGKAAMHEEMLRGLTRAKEQGKARFIGLSTHSRQVEMIDTAITSQVYEVILAGYNFRQDKIIKPALVRANEAGLGVVAMKVFAGEYADKERNKPINKPAALKWVLQDPNVHTAVITFRTFDDFESLIPLLTDITLSEQEKKDLEEACNTTGLYCLGCGECLKSCPESLPVPDLMRAYMYTYGYREAQEGLKVLSNLNVGNDPCSRCDVCRITCTQGFSVDEKIKDILRLRSVPEEFLC